MIDAYQRGQHTGFGSLYTLGYAESNAIDRLETLMAQPRTSIVDIRYAPYSRWAPFWNKKALMKRYGQVRYTHVKALGNINYNNDQPIRLADPDEWVQKCARALQHGWSLILLCACKDYEQCHRKVVYELIQQALGTRTSLGEIIRLENAQDD